MDINLGNKIFIFHCNFCNIEYDHLNKFSLHIEEHLNICEDVFKDPILKFEAEPEEITVLMIHLLLFLRSKKKPNIMTIQIPLIIMKRNL